MQETDSEREDAAEAMRKLGLSFKQEKVIEPLLLKVELAMKKNQPVSFDDYAKSVSHRAPKEGFTEQQLARNAVSDLKDAIAYRNDFSLWEGEQKEHEKTVAEYKPAGLWRKLLGNSRVERAKERINTIEGYRKERKESVERMTEACKYIRKMHF